MNDLSNFLNQAQQLFTSQPAQQTQPQQSQSVYGPPDPRTGLIGGMAPPVVKSTQASSQPQAPQSKGGFDIGSFLSGIGHAISGGVNTLGQNLGLLASNPGQFAQGVGLGLNQAAGQVGDVAGSIDKAILSGAKGVGENLSQPYNQLRQTLATTPPNSISNIAKDILSLPKAAGQTAFNLLNVPSTFTQQSLEQTPLQKIGIHTPLGYLNVPGLAAFGAGFLTPSGEVKTTEEGINFLKGLTPELQDAVEKSPGLLQKLISLFKGEVPNVEQAVSKNLGELNKPVATESDNIIQKFLQSVQEAKPLRGQQEAITTTARGTAIERALKAEEEAGGGQAGFYAKLGAMKGELPKVSYTPIKGLFTQGEQDLLHRTITSSDVLDKFDQITAQHGLENMLSGTVPTKDQIGKLEKVFGPEVTKALADKVGIGDKVGNFLKNAINFPRAIRATFDMSAPLRQGLYLGITNPKEFAGSFKEMFKYFASEKAYQGLQADIKANPLYGLMKEAKLQLTDIGGSFNQREEQFISNWAEKIPILGKFARASDRAYTGFLNKLRSDTFTSMFKDAQEAGLNPETNPKLLKSMGEFINTSSGRGSLGKLEGAATELNGLLFSPRLMASRLQMMNPQYYAKLDPFVRKQALKSFFGTLSLGVGILSLAKLAGASINFDPRNADFGKIKIGNTRIDVWGGMQQDVVALARLISNQYVSSTTGKVTNLGQGYKATTRADILGRIVRNKLAPVPAAGYDLLAGQNSVGQSITPQSEASNLFVPLLVQDINDLRTQNPDAIPLSVLSFFGTGVQTYSPTQSSSKTTSSPKAVTAGGRRVGATGKRVR